MLSKRRYANDKQSKVCAISLPSSSILDPLRPIASLTSTLCFSHLKKASASFADMNLKESLMNTSK